MQGSNRSGVVRYVAVLAFAIVAMLAVAATALAGQSQPLKARGSAEQVQVTGATPGEVLKLRHNGKTVDTDQAGELGGVVFRDVKPGGGYTVGSETRPDTRSLQVFSNASAPPKGKRKIYKQTLPAGGYGYLKTRDGTKLAIDVHLPGPASDGPYPTLVEYSGYGYANPNGPQSSIQPIAQLLGFAVVDINMRGTGCSGGSFDYFERLQALDGYDAIESVATQPWVLHNKVGMMGVSYGGISQLFVAATHPPSLSAIAPLSVIDNTQTTLYPGGILNTGFALNWGQERVDDSQPATATTGQGWAYQQIQNGDDICKANQDLHPEAVNLIQKIRDNRYYKPSIADPVSPVTFVDKIQVPVFMACQSTDEQTGGHCATLPAAMTGTKHKWFTFTNGTHIDSLDPLTFNRWYDFLQLFVAKQKPELSPSVKGSATVVYSAVMGVSGVTLPDDPIQAKPDYKSALAAYKKLPPVRVMFDNGAGGDPGQPYPGYVKNFSSFPVSGTQARSWYLGNDGKLSTRNHGGTADNFTWDPTARAATDFTGNTGAGNLWTASPTYDWQQSPQGSAVAYVSPRLGSDTTVIGGGEVQAWVRSSAANVDLQATISEVRPDDKETFVQSGWLRTEARGVDKKKSSLMYPTPDLRKSAAKTLPGNRWVKVRIPLYYQSHTYREGSRVKVSISAPDGDQPIWAFAEASPGGETPSVGVQHTKGHASRLILPVVPRISAPTPLPPCPGLRGEPCRDYEPVANDPFRGH
ncbi:hypothetical protein BH10ACT11_BH10ACT11_01300 [soil metagenome]